MKERSFSGRSFCLSQNRGGIYHRKMWEFKNNFQKTLYKLWISMVQLNQGKKPTQKCGDLSQCYFKI